MNKSDMLMYTVLACFFTVFTGFVAESRLGAAMSAEGVGVLIEVAVMGAFIIGAIYLCTRKPSESDNGDSKPSEQGNEQDK